MYCCFRVSFYVNCTTNEPFCVSKVTGERVEGEDLILSKGTKIFLFPMIMSGTAMEYIQPLVYRVLESLSVGIKVSWRMKFILYFHLF